MAIKKNFHERNYMNLFVRFVIFYEFIILLFADASNIVDFVLYIDVFIFAVAILAYTISILHQEHKLRYFIRNIMLVPILIPFFAVGDPMNEMIFRLLVCYGLVFNFTVPQLLKKFTSANLLKSLLILFFYILSFGTIMMHIVEGVSYADGLWWTIVTMTTIGYGDIYPVTNIGRFLALFVIFGGISCMAIFTAFIVEKAVGVKEKIKIKELSVEEVEDIRKQLKEIDENKLS